MGVETTAEGVSAAQSQADQITTPSQYPTATRIEDGFAYDKSGAKLGSVDENSLPNQPAPQAASKPQQIQNISGDDPAETILRGAQGLDNNARRDAWDAFTNSHDEDELTDKLQSMNLPQSVKAALWNAKYQASQKAVSAAREQAPPTDKPGFAQRVRESVGLPGSSADLHLAAQQEQDKTLKDRVKEAVRQSSYGPLVDTVEGLYGYGKRVNQNSANAGQEIGEAIQNVKEGGPVGANIGKAWSGLTDALVSDVPFIGEPTVSAGHDIASGPGTEHGDYGGLYFKGGNYSGAAGSLTGVVGQLVAGELIHAGEAKLVRANDARALEVANKTHTTSRAVYDTRVTDNVTAGNQARDAAVKAAQASEDYADGKISEAAKDEAHTNSNAAAANARKSTQALQDATVARNQAALEEAKAVRRIQENVKTKPDKSAQEAQAKAEDQHHTDLDDAMPGTNRGPAKLSDADRQVRSKYLRNYRDTVGPVNSVPDAVKAFTDIQQNMEARVKPFIEKYSGDLLPNDPRMAVHDAMADSPVKDFAAKGIAALNRYGDISHLTIGEADELRQQLNSENRSVLDNKTNTHDIATLLDTNPEFAARYHLADSLRNGTYDYLEDRGVQGVREIRQDEASIIRNRNAAEKALPKADVQVRSSSKSSWKRKAAAWSAHKASVGVGAKLFGPPGVVLGDIAGDKLGELIHPDDLTRDALVQRAMSVKGQGPAITPSIYGTGAEPNRLPALLIPELQRAMRENTPLHSDLATHYGQSVYDTSYGDLEDRFMKDIKDHERYGVPLEGDQKTLLNKINAQGAAEALKAHQAAQETQVQGKPPVPQATLPDQVDQVMPIQGTMPNGMSTQEGLIHDLAHIVVGNEKGIPFQDGVRSHLHPANAGNDRLLSAPINFTDFVDKNGGLDLNKLKPRIADFATTYVAGGVANDLWHGIPFTENHGLGADMSALKKFMTKVGFTEMEASKLIVQSADDAKQILSRPGTKEILEQHAAVREGGLDPEHHFSEERVQQILQDIKGDTNGEAPKKSARGAGEGDRASTEAGPGGKVEAEGRNAKGVPAKREGTPEGKVRRTEEEPEPVGSPALSSVKTTGVKEHDDVIRAAGATPVGHTFLPTEHGGEPQPHALYNDPASDSTLATPFGQLNRETVTKNLQENRAQYAPGNAVKSAKETGGFTFNPKTGEVPKTGYQVELFPERRGSIAGDVPTTDEIRDFTKKNQDVLQQHPELHVGGYGKELNLSARFADEAAAKNAAKKLDQISIWDNKNAKEVTTGGTGRQTEFGQYPAANRLQDLRTGSETPFGDLNRQATVQPQDLSAAIPRNAEQELSAATPELEAREARRVARQRELNRAFGEATRGEDFNPALAKAPTPTPLPKGAEKFSTKDFKPGETTAEHYANDPERLALRNTIKEEILSQAKPVPEGEKPTAYVTGGGTASGKSHFVRERNLDENAVNVDTDKVKTRLPEYREWKETDNANASKRVHGEASGISKDVLKDAVAQRKNIVIDSTTSGADDLDKIQNLKDNGYRVVLDFVDIPTDLAIEREKFRAENSPHEESRGRKTPLANIESTHKGAAESFFKLKGLADEAHVWDNSKLNQKPTQIYSQVAGSPESVYNQGRFDDYTNKASGRETRLHSGADSPRAREIQSMVEAEARLRTQGSRDSGVRPGLESSSQSLQGNGPETPNPQSGRVNWTPPEGLEKGIPRDEAVDSNIPLSELSVNERAYNGAASNYARKRGSKTEGPVSIVYNPDNGQYLVEDGMHRIVQAHQEGKATIPAKIWSGYSDIANVHPENKMDMSPIKDDEKPGEDLNPALAKSPKGSTVPLMKEPLDVKGTGNGDAVGTLDIAKALNKYSRKQNPALQPGANEVKMTDRAKKLAEDEAKYQLAQGKTGTEWYTTEMKDHDKILQGMRPELVGGEMTDQVPDHPVKLSLFKAAEAILSSGQKPYANFKAAVKAWDAYKETGEFPRTNPETGKSWGPRGVDAYGNGFDAVNQLIQEKGEKGAADWLLAEHPVSELKDYNKWVSGKKTNMVPGAMVLGEKRGPFMQNLHGIESAFTADMWVSRTWNRWMGTLDTDPVVGDKGKQTSESDVPRNNAERALMKESFEHAADKLGLSTSSMQAVLWYYEQALYRAHGIPVESWSFKDAAQRVARGTSGHTKG